MKALIAQGRHEALLRAALFNAVAVAVLDLHKPFLVLPNEGGYAECHGCDWGDYAEGAPEWPCTTVLKINEFLHVEGVEA
jgi:hypothetical protein